MPTNRSIPRNTNAATVAWMVTFAAGITAAPATYGLLAGDAAAINAVVTPYEAAFNLGGVTNRIPNNPATRTIPNTAAMDAARTAALAVCSAYAFQIQANPNVADMDKLAIGVAPRNFTRTPLFVPASAPLLNIQFATAGVQTLTFADSLTPAVKGKPAGAKGIQIFTTIGTVPAPTPDGSLYNVTASKNPVAVAFDPADAGKIATHFGRWVGIRGDVGPWSVGASLTIAF